MSFDFARILGVAVAVIGSLWRARQGRAVTTYGSARWAAGREIGRAGLFEPAGVLLGRVTPDSTPETWLGMQMACDL